MRHLNTCAICAVGLIPLMLLLGASTPNVGTYAFDKSLRGGSLEAGEDTIQTYYQGRNLAPLWTDGRGLSKRGAKLLQALSESGQDALNPSDYYVEDISQALENGASWQAEMLLSKGLLRYGKDLGGRNASLLDEAEKAGSFTAFLDGLLPKAKEYRLLRRALKHYKEIAAHGGWAQIEDGPSLRLGDVDPRVPALRRRFAATSYLKYVEDNSLVFDEALEKSVYRFQQRHGLNPDGVIGQGTLADLNMPVEKRIKMLADNLRSLRADGIPTQHRALVVNLAAAELRLYEDGQEVLRSRIIVGRRDWPTPLVTGEIHALEINPTWTAPWKIARDELLPKIRQDPGYLSTKGFTVFDGWTQDAKPIDPTTVNWEDPALNHMPYILRQDPGPLNPLGAMKIFFDNPDQIFLHDTDRKGLFSKADRTLSHGCVRVEKIIELGAYLLKDNPDWSRERLDQAVASGETERVGLATSIPIYVIQRTAWAEAGGVVHFRKDVYGDSPQDVASAGGANE